MCAFIYNNIFAMFATCQGIRFELVKGVVNSAWIVAVQAQNESGETTLQRQLQIANS